MAPDENHDQEVIFYLCGSVPKGAADSRTLFWTQEHKDEISSLLNPLKAVFLDPNVRSDSLSDLRATFGRDLLHVSVADIVLVDGRAKKGLGVGAEMTLANFLRIPVVSWCPTGSHYVKRDFSYLNQFVGRWTHPFVQELSDHVCEQLSGGIEWVKENYCPTSMGSRSSLASAPPSMYGAVLHYISEQIENDTEMRNLLVSSKKLQARVSDIL